MSREHELKDFPKDRLQVPRYRKGLRCKHCTDSIPADAYCELCKKFHVNQCSSCHDELAHDTIKVQNINTSGGRKYRDASRSVNKGFGFRSAECKRRS